MNPLLLVGGLGAVGLILWLTTREAKAAEGERDLNYEYQNAIYNPYSLTAEEYIELSHALAYAGMTYEATVIGDQYNRVYGEGGIVDQLEDYAHENPERPMPPPPQPEITDPITGRTYD